MFCLCGDYDAGPKGEGKGPRNAHHRHSQSGGPKKKVEKKREREREREREMLTTKKKPHAAGGFKWPRHHRLGRLVVIPSSSGTVGHRASVSFVFVFFWRRLSLIVVVVVVVVWTVGAGKMSA